MTLLFVIIGILCVLFCICYTCASVYYRVFSPKKTRTNPYIDEHLQNLQNDRDYESYIAYLNERNLDGVPIDKRLSRGEFEMKKELGLI